MKTGNRKQESIEPTAIFKNLLNKIETLPKSKNFRDGYKRGVIDSARELLTLLNDEGVEFVYK